MNVPSTQLANNSKFICLYCVIYADTLEAQSRQQILQNLLLILLFDTSFNALFNYLNYQIPFWSLGLCSTHAKLLPNPVLVNVQGIAMFLIIPSCQLFCGINQNFVVLIITAR